MRALCIAGGGQAGSRTAGVLYHLNNQYKLMVGTSTGAGLITVAHRKEAMKAAYTNTHNKDIWKVRGVNKKDAPRWGIFLLRLLSGHTSWGDSSNLFNTIKRFYPQEVHDQSIQDGVELVVCVWDQTKQKIKYFSNLDGHSYQHFVKYIEASMSAPPAMNIVNDPASDNLLEDGGVSEVLPLKETVIRAAKYNIKNIDCFVHDTKSNIFEERTKGKPFNHIHRAMRALKAQGRSILRDDINFGLNTAKELKVNVFLYYMPEDDLKPRFYFMPEKQKEWFEREPIEPIDHINNR